MPFGLIKKLLGRKPKKKRIWKILLLAAILVIGIIIFYFVTTILPIFLLSSTTTTLVIEDDIIFTDNNIYKAPNGPAAGEGEAIKLSGGLEAMGVDFNATLASLQDSLAKAETAEEKNSLYGKIAYVQLFQIMNAETEITSHPIMLLGTAMGIREMSLFSGNYSDITTLMNGNDYSLGIYGTWCNKYINGLPNKGGGIIKHSMTKAQASILSLGETAIPNITFTDLTTNTSTILPINQTYADVYITDGEDKDKAKGYNKGAYGPLQIEADHWVTWICPYVENNENYNSYLNTEYINIPLTDKRFDDLYSAAKAPVGNTAQSVVTSEKSHLAYYRQNKEFVDNLMATVGHTDYIQEFAALVNDSVAGKATFGEGTNYYFVGRFTKGTDWDDWVMSLEAWPHAFTCFAVDRIASYCMFDNTAELKTTGGSVIAGGAFKNSLADKFGTDFTFVNETAEEIYWTLEMLQSWNYGAPNTNYEADWRYNLAYLYRELANYIAIYGTADIREERSYSENCNPRAKCSCGKNHKVSVYSGLGTLEETTCTNFAYDTYLNLTNLVCTANGTRYNADGTDSDIYKAIHSALYSQQSSSYHKNNYGYAITAILDAEANTQSMMRDLFGLENFSIFNYGGTVESTGEAPILDSYDYNKEVPASTAIDVSYFEDAVFIGDSLTVSLESNVSCNTAGFFCKTGASSTSLISEELLSGLASATYNKVYLMIGINEVNNNSSTFETNYKTLIDTILSYNPNAIIYVQSILPVTTDQTNTYGSTISNDQIQVQNNVIRKIASEKKCLYLNVREAFVNDDKSIKEELLSDGLHLKAEGYTTWYNYLQTHTVQTTTTTEGESTE